METAAHRCHIGCFLFRRFPQMMVHAAAAQADSLSFLYVLQKKKKSQRIRAAGNGSEDSIALFPQMIFMGKGKHPFKKVLFLHSLLGLNTSASRSPSERSLSLTMISGRAKYSMRLSRMATPATMMSALSGMSPVKWHLSS